MDKFTGSLEQLKELVTASGADGEWGEIANGHQFRSHDGAKLNWFSKTGKLQYQGVAEAAGKLKAALSDTAGMPPVAMPAPAVPVPALPVEKPKVFVRSTDTIWLPASSWSLSFIVWGWSHSFLPTRAAAG
jgi:hypothetical protein